MKMLLLVKQRIKVQVHYGVQKFSIKKDNGAGQNIKVFYKNRRLVEDNNAMLDALGLFQLGQVTKKVANGNGNNR